MAGAGAKLFVDGTILDAVGLNTFLMDQTIMRFASTSARDAAFGGAGEPVLAEGMFAYTDDTNTMWYYTGSAWESAGATTQALTLNAQTGTSYTYVLGDAGEFVTFDNGSAIGTVVPPNSTTPFPIGTQINVLQLGAGAVAFGAGVGVTLVSQGSKFRTNGQYAAATCVKIASDTWVVIGNLQV
jgi:hypothetical protein